MGYKLMGENRILKPIVKLVLFKVNHQNSFNLFGATSKKIFGSKNKTNTVRAPP
jgi:hypothetical protein